MQVTISRSCYVLPLAPGVTLPFKINKNIFQTAEVGLSVSFDGILSAARPWTSCL